jgi:DNA-binding CsgD family transcriptional regulator
MIHRSLYLALLFFLLPWCMIAQSSDSPLMQKGWMALTKDNDNQAFRYFFEAYEFAKKEDNTADKAEALLYLGICSYGASLENGLQYAMQSLGNYAKLEKSNPGQAEIGRSKCLQLISTIYTRQRKYSEAMSMSREVIGILENTGDKSGTLGLAYSSVGVLYEMQKQSDSAIPYFKLALSDFEKSNSRAYLPAAYVKVGEQEFKKKRVQVSLKYFNKALSIANATQNKQAQVAGLIALGQWHLNIDTAKALSYFKKANQIAVTLSDKTFELKTLQSLISLNESQKNYPEIYRLQSRLLFIKERFYSLEQEKIVKNLEMQFEVAEKNRKLALISKEKEVIKLSNYLLAICIVILLIASIAGYFYFKSINKRDRQLLKVKESLVDSLEKQRVLEEVQFRNDLEHRENQLSGITLQMLQKNELLNEIKTAIDNKQPLSEQQLVKMVNQHFEQNSKWSDFDRYFESINKNFYTRLKQTYPEISANDLKVCALIKLNMSIKEMSSILNISPDSVKTARYRLRKKLQLTADENLTDFILSV